MKESVEAKIARLNEEIRQLQALAAIPRILIPRARPTKEMNREVLEALVEATRE